MLNYFNTTVGYWKPISMKYFQTIYEKNEDDEYVCTGVNFYKRLKRIPANKTEVIFSCENLVSAKVYSLFLDNSQFNSFWQNSEAGAQLILDFEKDGFKYQIIGRMPLGLFIEYDKTVGFTEKDSDFLYLNLEKLDLSKIRLFVFKGNPQFTYIATGELECLKGVIDYESEKYLEENLEYSKDKIYIKENVGYMYYGKMKKPMLSISTSKDKKTKELLVKENKEKDVHVFVKAVKESWHYDSYMLILEDDDKYFTSVVDKAHFDAAISEGIKNKQYDILYKNFQLDLSIHEPLDVKSNDFNYWYKLCKDRINKFKLPKDVLNCLYYLEREKEGSISEIIKSKRIIVDNNNDTAVKVLNRIRNMFKTFVKIDDKKINIIDVIETCGIKFDKFIFNKDDLNEFSQYCCKAKTKPSYSNYYNNNIEDIGIFIKHWNSVDYQFTFKKNAAGDEDDMLVKANPEIKEGLLFLKNSHSILKRFFTKEKNVNYEDSILFSDGCDLPFYELHTIEDGNINFYRTTPYGGQTVIDTPEKVEPYMHQFEEIFPRQNMVRLAELLMENKIPLNIIASDEICFDISNDKSYYYSVHDQFMNYFSLIGHFDRNETERMMDKFTDFPSLFKMLENLLNTISKESE